MKTLRKAGERGRTHIDWLDSWHSFSFGEYHDPEHMGFKSLRVINDDYVAAGQGFGMHGHRDMEIVTYIVSGQLEHRDSLGNGSILKPGMLQRMTAGTGIRHSEFNPSASEDVHLLQIWILPEKRGLEPGYEERTFSLDQLNGKFVRVAAPMNAPTDALDAAGKPLAIHQDAAILVGRFSPGATATYPIAPGRRVWMHIIQGNASVDGQSLGSGDALAITDESSVTLKADAAVDVMVFDLK